MTDYTRIPGQNEFVKVDEIKHCIEIDCDKFIAVDIHWVKPMGYLALATTFYIENAQHELQYQEFKRALTSHDVVLRVHES